MKNTILFYLFFICFRLSSYAQINLVPNPSFEDTVMCPNSGGQVARARYWFSLLNTPDYFHSCNPYQQFSVPYNTLGYQYPNTGSAYMGLCDYTTDVPTFREIIGAFLVTPLTIGERYFVTFHACLAFNPPKLDCNGASNKLGILFSTVAYISTSPPITNYSQVYSDSIISDSISWTTVRGSFIADSAYSFISMTNFFDNAHTDTIQLDTTTHAHHCYYYIDDLCVSTDSSYSELWTSMPIHSIEWNILLYPNPAEKQITIDNLSFDCKRIEIYNIQGNLLFSLAPYRQLKISIDITSYAEGIYSVIIRKEKSIQLLKFIKSDN